MSIYKRALYPINMSQGKYIKKIDSGDVVRIENGAGNEAFASERKRSRQEKLLFVAVLILLIVAIIFIVLYVLEATKEEEVETTTKPTMTPVCLSPGCVFSASGQCNY